MAGNTERLDWGATGATIYALAVSRANGQFWNGTALEAYTPANYANYAVAMTEISGSGVYLLTAPAALPAGDYDFLMRLRAGGSPAATDPPAGGVSDYWDGFALYPLAEKAGATSPIFGTSGTVDVTITELNPYNAAIPGVEVWISQDAGGASRTQSETTDDFGQARFRLDPQSAYLWRELPGLTWTPNPLPITIPSGGLELVDGGA